MEGHTMTTERSQKVENNQPSTLKVLAMRIAAGQEFEGAVTEGIARRMWYDDHMPRGPYCVLIKGSTTQQLKLERLVTPWSTTIGDFKGWGFKTRSEADDLCAVIHAQTSLSYWLVGLSPRHTSAAKYPLIGFFSSPVDGRKPTEYDAKQTESMRIEAQTILGSTLPHPEITVVLALSESPFAPKNIGAEITGSRKIKDGTLFYAIFFNPTSAHLFFGSLTDNGAHKAWHFGHNRFE